MVGTGKGGHGVTIRVGSDSRALFVRWTPTGDEMNFIQMKSSLCRSRHCQVSDMNRVKRAAEKRDAPLPPLLVCNAVRFRRRAVQWASFFWRGLRGARATFRRGASGTTAKGASAGDSLSVSSGCSSIVRG